MSVTLQIRRNGGPAASGDITGASGDSIQLTAASKVGWIAASARWELADYPEGFACPAGWSTAADGSYYYATANDDPPAFTIGASEWGKWVTNLTANDGSGLPITDMATGLSVPSPRGIVTVGRAEGSRHGGTRKRWVRDLQRAVVTIDDILAVVSAAKSPVRCVIVANVALGAVPNASQADTLTLSPNDRILLSGQTDQSENGIYVVGASSLARASDMSTGVEVQLNAFVRVLEGAVYNGSWWHLTSPTSGAVTIGTTSIVFEEFKPARYEIEPNTLVLRNDEGNIKAAEIETSRALGPDAETLPNAFYLRGGRPSIANLGKEPYSNVVLQCGIGAQSTTGESAMLNFTHGDSRDPELGPEYIAAEMGFVDQYGYDPATTESDGENPPATRTWREKTPRYFRIHATQNTNNLKPIGVLLVGGVDLNMSASDLVQIGATARSGLLRRAWNNFTATGADVGDGQGGTIVEVNRYVSTTSNETKKLYVGADVPTSKLAMARCVVIGHSPGGNRDVFEFRFNWLGGAVGSGSAVVEALTAYPGSTALAGRVVVADEDFASGNLGKVRVSVTGLLGSAVDWTLHMSLFIPPIV